MSDLKHQTVEELRASKLRCEKYIRELESKLNGQRVRLKWIEEYLFQKNPQELSIGQIERLLGHKIIIKEAGE